MTGLGPKPAVISALASGPLQAMRGGTAVETVLRKSGELADLEAVAQSWFEDGPDIAQVIARRAHRRVATRDDASVAQPAKNLLRSPIGSPSNATFRKSYSRSLILSSRDRRGTAAYAR